MTEAERFRMARSGRPAGWKGLRDGASLLLGVLLLASAFAGCRLALPPSEPLPVLGELPPFRLVESNGTERGGEDLRGQVWVADFIFTTCPGLCPALTRQMILLQKDLPKQVRFVSFSVDPEKDRPEVLREYARRHGGDGSRWWLFTGEREAMYRLVREGFRLAVAEDVPSPVGEPILHSDRFVLVDARGRIRGYYRGTDEEGVQQLRQDAGRLVAEDPEEADSSLAPG